MASTGLVIAGLAAGAGSLGAGAIGASAAGNAAATQAQSSEYAANLQEQEAANALNFEQQQWATTQANEAPFIGAGQGATTTLENLLGIQPPASAPATNVPTAPVAVNGAPAAPVGVAGGTPSNLGTLAAAGGPIAAPTVGPSIARPTANVPGSPVDATGGPGTPGWGSLLASYPGGSFTAPTAAQAAATPGYEFTLQQGEQALQRSAAAQGNLLTGGTAKDLIGYGQGLASTDYEQAYNNALNSYNTNYNVWAQNQANEFNRLAAVAGFGQTSAGTLGQLGAQTAGTVSNTSLGAGQQIGQSLQNAGAATASGYVGAANAYGGALNNLGNEASTLALLQGLKSGSNQNPSWGSDPSDSVFGPWGP